MYVHMYPYTYIYIYMYKCIWIYIYIYPVALRASPPPRYLIKEVEDLLKDEGGKITRISVCPFSVGRVESGVLWGR